MADEELPMPKGVRTRTAHTYTFGSNSSLTRIISEYTYDEEANAELRRLAAIGKRRELSSLECELEAAKGADPEPNHRALEDWELGLSAISGVKRILTPEQMDVQVSWLSHEVRKLKEALRDRT